MEELDKLIKSNPKFRSNKSEYLKLAIREGNTVKGTGSHALKVVGCENAVNKDYKTQQNVKGVNLLFTEDGEPKRYFVPILGNDGKFHYLIERFVNIEKGIDVVMEYKRKEGSVKGFIDVQVIGNETAFPPNSDDIPIVEDGTVGEEELFDEITEGDFGGEQGV